MEPRTKEDIVGIQKRRTARLVSDDSPVPLEARRKGFAGLEYFPVNPSYQFRLRLQRYESPVMVRIGLSNGEFVEALRFGFLEFSLDGLLLWLQVYKKRPDDVEVFVPFRDSTSGVETFGAGRYLDFDLDSLDGCVLDFNLAYNPLCAFDSSRFVCPCPPAENWLMDVEIREGEKRFVG